MQIQSFQPHVGRALKGPEQQPPQPDQDPKETFTPQDEPFLGGWGPTLAAAAARTARNRSARQSRDGAR